MQSELETLKTNLQHKNMILKNFQDGYKNQIFLNEKIALKEVEILSLKSNWMKVAEESEKEVKASEKAIKAMEAAIGKSYVPVMERSSHTRSAWVPVIRGLGRLEFVTTGTFRRPSRE